jgi:hypothetical protein
MRLNIVRSLEQKAELLLTTGTFNLLSKIEPHSRLSGAFSTEWKPATCAASVLELCFRPHTHRMGGGQSQTFQTYRDLPLPVNRSTRNDSGKLGSPDCATLSRRALQQTRFLRDGALCGAISRSPPASSQPAKSLSCRHKVARELFNSQKSGRSCEPFEGLAS